MKQTEQIMGMPVTIILLADDHSHTLFAEVFDYFRSIDEQFSPYKKTSEVAKINQGLPEAEWSDDMRLIVKLAEQTKAATQGYFDVWHNGRFDPSGIVKGWAIDQAAQLLHEAGRHDFYIEAGGDIAVSGYNEAGDKWNIGIRNPFERSEIVKVLQVSDCGVATSGTAIRGQHIYNPHAPTKRLHNIISLTVVGPTIYDADRFATAAFAMGPRGIEFIENLDGFEGYAIDKHGIATMTSGFEALTKA